MNGKRKWEFKDKVIKGLDLAYSRMLEEKRKSNQPIVVLKDGKIVYLNP